MDNNQLSPFQPSIAHAYWDKVLIEYLGDLRHDIVKSFVDVLQEAAQSAPAIICPLLDTSNINAEQALHAIESLLSHSADTVSDRWELYAFHYVFAVPPHVPVPISQQSMITPQTTTPPDSLLSEIRKKSLRIAALKELIRQVQANSRNLEQAIQNLEMETHIWSSAHKTLQKVLDTDVATDQKPLPAVQGHQPVQSNLNKEHTTWYQRQLSHILHQNQVHQDSSLPLVPAMVDLTWFGNKLSQI